MRKFDLNREGAGTAGVLMLFWRSSKAKKVFFTFAAVCDECRANDDKIEALRKVAFGA